MLFQSYFPMKYSLHLIVLTKLVSYLSLEKLYAQHSNSPESLAYQSDTKHPTSLSHPNTKHLNSIAMQCIAIHKCFSYNKKLGGQSLTALLELYLDVMFFVFTQ